MLVIVSLANVPILDPRSRTTMATLKDIVRTTFRMRVKRRLDSSGAVPEVGARIVLNGMRMQVVSPLNEETWQWLQLQGWRESRFRNDRRSYIEIPKEAFERLRMSGSKQRERVHRRIVDLAARKLAA